MTVASTITTKQYTGNGATTQFAFPNKIFSASDLQVTIIDNLGNQFPFTNFANAGLGLTYTVQGVDVDTGCTVVLSAALTNLWTIDIRSVVPQIQSTSIKNQGSFLPELHEEEFDRLTRNLQDLLRRTYTFGIHAADIESTAWPALPAPSVRAGAGLVFDSNGLPTVGILASTVITGPIVANLLNLVTTIAPTADKVRTPAEIVVGVTPVNYAFLTFDVTRFGAVGDGSTVNTTAIQNALNVANIAGIRVHFPSQNLNGQTVYLTGPLTVSQRTYVTADPGVIIQSTNTNANLQVFQCLATLGSATNLTANASLGATSVSVTSAAGLAAGQVVKISDSSFLVGSVPNFEHNEILSVSGTTINLKQALIGNYTTANTAQLTPHSAPARDIHFENVHVLLPTTGGIDGGSFYFQDAYNCSVRNCESQGAKFQPSIQVWRSAYVNIYGGVMRDGQNQSTPGQGYGINIAQGSHHCVAFDVEMRNIRECAVSLGARFSGFYNCVSYSPYDNGFNGHGSGSFDCFAIGCRIIGSSGPTTKGVYAGANDLRMSFLDCSVVNISGRAIWLDSGSVDCEVKNFRSFNSNMQGSAASDACVLLLSATRPRVTNVTIDGNNQNATRSGIRVDTCTDAIVRGGAIRNVSAGWGVLHANCAGVQIDDIAITNVTQGIAFDTTPSTGTYIRRNKVDNNTAFGVNAGDVCEFNEYSSKRQNSRGKTSGSVADGGTIAHGCVNIPYRASVFSLGSNGTDIVKVSAVDGTNITVTIKTPAGAAGSSVPIMWEADS